MSPHIPPVAEKEIVSAGDQAFISPRLSVIAEDQHLDCGLRFPRLLVAVDFGSWFERYSLSPLPQGNGAEAAVADSQEAEKC